MTAQGLSFQGLQESEGSVIQSDLGPTLAATDTTLFQAWKGSGGDTRIWYSAFNGSSWGQQQSFPDPIRTNARPGLGFLGTTLWAAWKSAGNDNSIYYANYDGGWTEQSQLVLPNSPAVKTTDGPAIASFGGRLYMMWKGSPDNGIYWTYFDPSTGLWIPQQRLPPLVQSTAGPGLAAFSTRSQNLTLCAAWKGSPDNGLYYSFLASGSTTWTHQQQMPSPIGSNDGPSLAGISNTLIAAWRGNGDEGLYYTGYNNVTKSLGYIGGLQNGAPVQEQLPNPLGSNIRPSIAAFINPPDEGQLFLFFNWKGTDTDHSLYWTTATPNSSS